MQPWELAVWGGLDPEIEVPDGVEVRRGLIASRWVICFYSPTVYAAKQCRGFVSVLESALKKENMPALFAMIDSPLT